MGKAAPGDPIFMKVPGVLGEPTEKGHENWIELDSWNWNVTRKSGKPSFSAISVAFCWDVAARRGC